MNPEIEARMLLKAWGIVTAWPEAEAGGAYVDLSSPRSQGGAWWLTRVHPHD